MPSPGVISHVEQTLYAKSYPPIQVTSLHENRLNDEVLEVFLDCPVIGLAGEYKSGRLSQLILALPHEALRIHISSANTSKDRSKYATLSQRVLLNPKVTLIAFNLDRLALTLHCDMDLRINNGVDLLSLLPERVVRTAIAPIVKCLNTNGNANASDVANAFQDENKKPNRVDTPILRAWSACYLTSHPGYLASRLASVLRIDTSGFGKNQLNLLAQFIRIYFKQEALKPTFAKNDISENISFKNGKVQVFATRFKTRPRVSGSQFLRFDLKGGNNTSQKGHVKEVNGREVTISAAGLRGTKDIRGITTIGREEPTAAESLKAEIILNALQGNNSLFLNPIVSVFWFPSKQKESPQSLSTFSSERPKGVKIHLNGSQSRAINSMLRCRLGTDVVQVTIVHGPPGSGKTSVVAGFVEAIQNISQAEYGEAIYLIAQSNVAVKNMAEKLAKIGFHHWKLIVSHDFHFDWHEHLYEKIRPNVVESADLPQTYLELEREFLGVRVILCTLSMLSNPRLDKIGLIRLFPPKTIVVDEASQIELGDYLPVFQTFKRTLRRICLAGDDKQLAPYGQEDIPEIKSVFEIPHLRKAAIFLDTQYRMPLPIGAFISRKVYDGHLHSSHSIHAKKSCQWVDVADGVEKSEGHSWKNQREIQIIVHLVRQAHRKREEFRVITPYDAQRNEIEKALKQAGLPWENRCFNVDSFQGNEADHIIVSIVRTKKAGFLTNKRRTNVLLTRCKKKMTICSNRYFLEHVARKTLVGSMAADWGPDSWVSGNDVLNGRL